MRKNRLFQFLAIKSCNESIKNGSIRLDFLAKNWKFSITNLSYVGSQLSFWSPVLVFQKMRARIVKNTEKVGEFGHKFLKVLGLQRDLFSSHSVFKDFY